MALTIDTSTPAVKATAANASTVTSNTFSPPAGSLLAAVFGLDGPGNLAQTVASVTDSLGSHLNWTMLVRDNMIAPGFGGGAEIWIADCPSAQTNMTVSGTFARASGGGSSPDGHLAIIVFNGAAPVVTQTGATGRRNSTAQSSPSVSVTTTAAGSWVIGEFQDYNTGTGPTVGTGQTTTINSHAMQSLNASDGDGYWTQIQNATTTASGTNVTMNDTLSAFAGHVVVVEVLAGTGGGGGGTPVNLTLEADAVTESDATATAPGVLGPVATAVTQALATLQAGGIPVSPAGGVVSAAVANVTAAAGLMGTTASTVTSGTLTVKPQVQTNPVAGSIATAALSVTVSGTRALTVTAGAAASASAGIMVRVPLMPNAVSAVTAVTAFIRAAPTSTRPVPGSGETPLATTPVPGSGETPISTAAVPASREPVITTGVTP